PWYHLDLEARQDGDFDVLFRHHELNGWGDTKYEALFRVFRGLPFQTLYPEYFNLGGRGINLISLLRWDAQKRRAFGTLSGPFRGSSKYRYELSADLRSENWELLSSFTGPALFRGGFNFRRAALSGGISSIESRRWAGSGETFLKLRPELRLHWLPQSQGDDYEMVQQIRAGKTFGDLPFDELAMLGVERDNDLWLRGHIGTRDGRKGSAPLGRNYFLSNFEMDKKVYSNGLLIIKIGPFVDTGKITDPVIRLGPRKWLWDVGVQSKFQVFGVG